VKGSKSTGEINATWCLFRNQFHLSVDQIQQFQEYSTLLCEWNKKINLTAITDPKAIIIDHFQDSVMLSLFLDLNTISMIADVGTGAGFPGIPLKICYPHLSVILIEVVKKKIVFLEALINALGLENITISSLDWRTFLRKTSYPIELFCARASLPVSELISMFKPASPYCMAQLVYWASEKWVAPTVVQPFLRQAKLYTINSKKRLYVFFQSTEKVIFSSHLR